MDNNYEKIKDPDIHPFSLKAAELLAEHNVNQDTIDEICGMIDKLADENYRLKEQYGWVERVLKDSKFIAEKVFKYE